MKSLLTAIAIASIFASCKSKTESDKELLKTNPAVGVIDAPVLRVVPDGTKRVTVVETRNANGSSTITTTTDTKVAPVSAGKTNTVSSNDKPSPAPVVSPSPVASPAPVATTAAKKTGWSSRAKGAAIGGVGGAAAGAIISKKNKVAGAVLGGAVGAGGGYIIGNEIDRKKAKP